MRPATGMNFWIDASQSDTVTLTSGKVSQVDDLSGSGNHAVQGTAANRPLYAEGFLNGLNALAADGDDELVMTSLTATDRTCTMFAVGAAHNLANFAHLFVSNAVGGLAWRIDQTTGALNTDSLATANIGNQGNAAVSPYVPFIAVCNISATNVEHILNGVSETDSNSTALSGAGTMRVLTTYIGLMGEMISYPNQLSAGDIAQTTGYLKQKWGISF